MRSFAPYLLKLIVTALCVWFVFQQVNITQLKEILLSLEPTMVCLSLVAMICQNIAGAIRWWYCCLAQALTFSFQWCIKTYYSGIFLALVFPGTLGLDGYRVINAKIKQSRLKNILSTVIHEKVLALVSLILMTIPFQTAFTSTAKELQLLYIFLLVGTVCFFLLTLAMNVKPASSTYTSNASSISEKIVSFTELLLPPRTSLLYGLILASISNLLIIITYVLLWKSLFLQWPTMHDAALFIPLILLTSLPVSFGGWGLREGALIVLFASKNLSSEKLVIIGVAFGLLQTIAALPGAATLLLTKHNKK